MHVFFSITKDKNYVFVILVHALKERKVEWEMICMLRGKLVMEKVCYVRIA